jgi:hypothetical protein
MSRPKLPHKPPAPSVRDTVSQAIARARGLPREEHPMTQQQVVLDILNKVSLPEAFRRDLRRRHGLEQETRPNGDKRP